MEILSRSEQIRYSRHLLLDQVGEAGQAKLKSSSVLVIGAGGLGSPVLQYLAAAGVGRLGVLDFDVVDLSNLQRQVIHSTVSVGSKKTDSAQLFLQNLNSEIKIETFPDRLDASNALNLLSGFDVIVDGSDNFQTRYLVNDASVLLGKPLVYGAVSRFDGQVSIFNFQGGPCYRCLFPEPPGDGLIGNCSELGVLGVLPGIIGSMQALETLKILLGLGKPLSGRLVIFDGLSMSMDEIRIKKSANCPVCGENPSITRLTDEQISCEIPSDHRNLSPETVKFRLNENPDILLLDVREPEEVTISRIPKSVHIPLKTMNLELVGKKAPKDLSIILYCKSGVRSRKAMDFLLSEGYQNVSHLEGGILAWRMAGFPVETGERS